VGGTDLGCAWRLGLSLHQVMRGIKVSAEAHMDGVLANREKYDTCTASEAI
jgi:hypothetical protein